MKKDNNQISFNQIINSSINNKDEKLFFDNSIDIFTENHHETIDSETSDIHIDIHNIEKESLSNIIEEENSLIESLRIFNAISHTHYSQAVSLRMSQVYFNTHRIEESEEMLNQLINDIDVDDNVRSSALISLAFIILLIHIPFLLFSHIYLEPQ